jgi:hypothetical protein
MVAPVAPPAFETPVAPPAPPPCPNCGATMVAEFCARCGELQPAHRDLSIQAVAVDVAQDFAGIDGKVPRTLWALIAKPGLLTREFIDGRRGRYSKPLSLFLVLNVIFFLIQPHTGLLRYNFRDYAGGDGDVELHRAKLAHSRAAAENLSDSAYAIRFDATLDNQKKSMLLFAVPVLALMMVVIFAGSRRYFVEHLVFAVHTYAFMLVMLAVGTLVILYAIAGWVFLLDLVGLHLPGLDRTVFGEPGLVAILSLSLFTYAVLAVRRAYGGAWWTVALRAGVIAFVQLSLIPIYRDLLFYTTLYST